MQMITDILTRVKVGTETTFRNLTVFPLLDGGNGEPDYLTLDEALAQRCARITEVSAGGSVPELKFINEGNCRVLLLDGEELVGAKQNRVLNLTILAPAKRTLVIPVSCVEAGRWAHLSAEFAAAPHAHYAAGRGKKMAQVTESLRVTGQRRSDQSEVWADIAEKAERLGAHSPTHAMAEIYERHATQLEEYVRAFTAADGQVGAMFVINGNVIGCDLFDYATTLNKLLPKLVRSYALDAIDAQEEKPPAPTRAAVEELLHAVAKAEARSFSAIGEGQDVRFTGTNLTGGALVANGRVVHLSAFRLEDAQDSPSRSFDTGISRASIRRQHHQGR